jgi:TMEM175 potassium channel family protein
MPEGEVELPKSPYPRGSEEFDRVLAFSDGLFAIAMTLLVVALAVPALSDTSDISELADALDDLSANFVSFFISFAVIGRYWAAHHQFFALLKSVDYGLIGINLVYLCFIAFLPFPTALLGEYFDNPLAVAIYAVSVALVSGLEVVEFRHAYRNGLLGRPMPENVYHYGVLLSLSPVAYFLLSVPIAFIATWLAVATWFIAVPAQVLFNRWKPTDADDYLS